MDLGTIVSRRISQKFANGIPVDFSEFGPAPRFGHALVSAGGQLFVFGGFGYFGQYQSYLNDLYIFDPVTVEWNDIAPAPTGTNTIRAHGTPPYPRSEHGFVHVNGKLYVHGGLTYRGPASPTGTLNDFLVLNLANMTWTDLSTSGFGRSPSSRYGHGFASAGGKLYVHGGASEEGVQAIYFNDLFVFDLTTLTWTDLTSTALGKLPSPRYNHCFTQAAGRIYLHGGVTKAEVLSDLFMYDPDAASWEELTTTLAGLVPEPRFGHGCGLASGKLFLHGGRGINQDIFQDIRAFSIPMELYLTPGEYGWIDIFDWDTVLLDELSSFESSYYINLCSGIFPCALHFKGNPTGFIKRSGNGSISCLASSGCTGITLESINLACESYKASDSAFKVQGSKLLILNSSFSGCSSNRDGSIIQSYDRAYVNITLSSFLSIHSAGHGGAVSAFGSEVHVYESTFFNCSSDSGGGAVWASSFESCYGTIKSINTTFSAVKSIFRECKSNGGGGAIFAHSNSLLLSDERVHILSIGTDFVKCNSSQEGGAVLFSGSLVFAHLLNSTFSDCRAATMGGAISVSNSAETVLVNCVFEYNSARGLGGGALHMVNSWLSDYDSTYFANAAPEGGGGLLFWQGNVFPRMCQGLDDFCARGLCSGGNTAVYGPCLASDYKSLHVLNQSETTFAGLDFPLLVVKRDAYNQTVASDSESVLQVYISLDGSQRGSPSSSIVGTTNFHLEKGQANFSTAIKPAFSNISFHHSFTKVESQPYLYFKGLDSQNLSQVILSEPIPIHLSSGQYVCPEGYFLLLDDETSLGGPASCTFCKPGTYSVDPLAAGPDSPSKAPSCLNCPAGGNCINGGHSVKFKIGLWMISNGMYKLFSCPPGYQLVNSTAGTSGGIFSHDQQQCLPCVAGLQYILNPNQDSCQSCPLGLSCMGTDIVQSKLENSTWIRNGSIYLLTSCPTGYQVASKGASGAFDASVQQCIPCGAGEECLLPICTHCFPCNPGFYKSFASAQPCLPCPSDAYGTDIGATQATQCLPCPLRSTTLGKTRSSSLFECVCLPQYYPLATSSTLECKICPSAAVCPDDGMCSLRNAPLFNCSGTAYIVGSWILQGSEWTLVSCPAGYSLSAQRCMFCPASYYCIGGTFPAAPCGAGLYSLPGANSSSSCFQSVFVIVTMTVPIVRPEFTDSTSLLFQSALAFAAVKLPSYVSVIAIVQSSDGLTTTVTSNIATSDAYEAKALSESLEMPTRASSDLSLKGFDGCVVTLIQVTACVSGFELLPSRVCQICPANYFCVGGSIGSEPCPVSSFSSPGSNSSTSCKPAVFVLVTISLPITKINFTDAFKLKFRRALALTAGADVSRVIVLAINQGITRRGSNSQVLVNSEIAADDSSSAETLSNNIDQSKLNQNLDTLGLPLSTVVAVTVSDINRGSSNGISLPVVVGASVGCFIFVFIATGIGYFLLIIIWRQRAHKAFLSAFMSADAGDVALPKHLPLYLLKRYIPERVLGKGAYGCVVLAKNKESSKHVAIKLIVPQRNVFDDKEIRQLKREAGALQLYTTKKCEHAVNLAGVDAVQIRKDVSWFIMDYLEGDNMDSVIHTILRKGGSDMTPSELESRDNPINHVECIKVARNVLAALKVMHAEGVVHRDLKPANIMRCKTEIAGMGWDGHSFTYKLVDFGTALGIDDTVAKEVMMTLVGNRNMGAGTPPYMSPEMFKTPEKAMYPTDLWSLGVTMFELVTVRLPFQSESELLWSIAVAGNMDEKAPDILDMLEDDKRSKFDHNLAKVVAKALEKRVAERYTSVDEMHDAVYRCLIDQGEAFYSLFISYRVASEAPLARLMFDELNHSVTPGGHRVTVYWDAHRLVKGQDWEEGFATGLLNSLCIFPLLSYGATAPLAALPEESLAASIASGWEERPVGRQRLQGAESDWEDNVLKELLIAGALLERTAVASGDAPHEKGMLQVAYPILVGRQQPEGHPDYPRMGNFFHVQAGGGQYPLRPSPPTSRAVAGFLLDKAGLDPEAVRVTQERSVLAAVGDLTRLQGCQLWNHPEDLPEEPLTKEQEGLVGKGYAGPPVDLNKVALSLEQREACGRGLDERHLRMLKAEVRAKRADFHEIIDRAVSSHALQKGPLVGEHGKCSHLQGKSCVSMEAAGGRALDQLPGPSEAMVVLVAGASLECGAVQGDVPQGDSRRKTSRVLGLDQACEVSAIGELVYAAHHGV